MKPSKLKQIKKEKADERLYFEQEGAHCACGNYFKNEQEEDSGICGECI